MVPSSARQVAFLALRHWQTKREFADTIIAKIGANTSLRTPDRAFALELFYGALRNLTLLDFWIHSLRSTRLDIELRDILRLGLYQLLLADTAEHAAVYETVNLAPKSKRGVVNGVLRNASRRRKELLAEANAQPLEVRTSHPRFLVTRWEKHFGSGNVESLCQWNNRPPPIYARINSLSIDRATFLEKYPDVQAIETETEFVQMTSFERRAVESGDCYVQDPSTALAPKLLDPKPGERVLDACAAPGGKAAHLAELMQNKGLIVACDHDAERITLLKENLKRLSVEIAKPIQHDWTKSEMPVGMVDLAPFDRILVDAPCSNTGVMRRRVDVRWRLKPSDFERMPKLQLSILRSVLPLLKKEGTLVYSTCSLEPEENEQVARQLTKEFANVSIDEQKDLLPFRDNFDGVFVTRLTKN